MMAECGQSEPGSIMDVAPRAVVHLRAQEQRNRLGLIFGSGASKDLGFPDWPDLIQRLGKNEKVNAQELPVRLGKELNGSRLSLAALTQIMFQEFRKRRLSEQGLSGSVPALAEHQIKS